MSELAEGYWYQATREIRDGVTTILTGYVLMTTKDGGVFLAASEDQDVTTATSLTEAEWNWKRLPGDPALEPAPHVEGIPGQDVALGLPTAGAIMDVPDQEVHVIEDPSGSPWRFPDTIPDTRPRCTVTVPHDPHKPAGGQPCPGVPDVVTVPAPPVVQLPPGWSFLLHIQACRDGACATTPPAPRCSCPCHELPSGHWCDEGCDVENHTLLRLPDAFRELASEILGCHPEEVTPAQRLAAKNGMLRMTYAAEAQARASAQASAAGPRGRQTHTTAQGPPPGAPGPVQQRGDGIVPPGFRRETPPQQ